MKAQFLYRPAQSFYFSRTGVAATESSDVIGVPFILPPCSGGLWAHIRIVINGSPATVDARLGINGIHHALNENVSTVSAQQLIRIIDHTSTSSATYYARLRVSGEAGDEGGTATNVDLAAANAALVVNQGPLPDEIRVLTRLQTLTGGSSPSVDFYVGIVAA